MKMNLIIVFWKALEVNYKSEKWGVLFKKFEMKICPNLNNATQGQTNDTILCFLRSPKTFVWNILP